jgi:ABC-type nitrate/sulfonate/bicarbonate transport system substrate-binding protein
MNYFAGNNLNPMPPKNTMKRPGRRNLKKIFITAWLALLLLIFAPLRPVRAELFRIALSTRDFGYLPLYVGMRAGMFAQENLDVQWIQVGSSVVVTALLAGEIDVAGIAGSSMRAAARGAPLKAIFFPTTDRCSFSWARRASSACRT